MSEPFEEQQMVEVRLGRIVIRDGVDQQWIFLVEKSGTRGFPIIIGSNEAFEIHRVVTRIQPERPLTHQLAFASIQALGASVKRVDIVDLRNNTFYAQMILAKDDSDFTAVLDARPSDALAIGLRAGCPIRVAESVLQQVRTDDSADPDDPGAHPDDDD